jgi:lipoate-protein ligase A
MTKIEAINKIIDDIDQTSGSILFKKSLMLDTITELMVGLDKPHVDKLKTIVGDRFFDFFIDYIKENRFSFSDLGFSKAIDDTLNTYEVLLTEGVITYQLEDGQEQPTPEQNEERVSNWLKNIGAE